MTNHYLSTIGVSRGGETLKRKNLVRAQWAALVGLLGRSKGVVSDEMSSSRYPFTFSLAMFYAVKCCRDGGSGERKMMKISNFATQKSCWGRCEIGKALEGGGGGRK